MFTHYMQFLKVQMAEGGMEDLGLHLHTITLGFTITNTTLGLVLNKTLGLKRRSGPWRSHRRRGARRFRGHIHTFTLGFNIMSTTLGLSFTKP